MPSDIEELAEAVLTASRVLVAVAAHSLAGHESEVSLVQFRALVVVASRGPQRPVDLAHVLDLDPSTVTRLCDRLEAKDFIVRRRSESDRREVQVELTGTGRAMVESVTDLRRGEIRRIVEKVPAAQRPDLVRAFRVFGEAAGEIPDEQWQRSWDL